MHTNLKSVAGLALVVVLSAGLAMAGRGGGHSGGGHSGGGGHAGGGHSSGGHSSASHAGGHAGGSHAGGSHAGGRGGGSHAGGTSRPAATHTPSFSTPRPAVHTVHATKPAVRTSVSKNVVTQRPAVSPGSRPVVGQRPGIAAGTWANTARVDNHLSTAYRPSISNRADIAGRTSIATVHQHRQQSHQCLQSDQ